MSVAYLNIGSNQGDRHAFIERAVALIELLSDSPVMRSDYVLTAPWGFESPNQFLNLGVAIEWQGTPLQLLDRLQAVERAISPLPHRDGSGNYIDRAIDIDIIAIGQTIVESERLTIPHPKMHLREFVLKPMIQLAPEWIHPKLKLTAKELWKHITC